MNLGTLIFGTLCRDCAERHRSDVCPRCFASRLARAERCDSRVIAHPEEDWDARLAAMQRARWQDQKPKRRLRAVR